MFCEMAMMQVLLVLSFLNRIEPFHLNRIEPFNLNRISYSHYGTLKNANKNPVENIDYTLLGINGRFLGINRKSVSLSMTSEPLMEDGVTLNTLKDPVADGTFLKESIQRWLDEEYIPQDVHSELGEVVKQVYIEKRLEGCSDLGEMMMTVGTALESIDMGEAFVGAWDVANKVSDLLMLRLDRELCSCAGDLSKFNEKKEGNEGGKGGGGGKSEGMVGTGGEVEDAVAVRVKVEKVDITSMGNSMRDSIKSNSQGSSVGDSVRMKVEGGKIDFAAMREDINNINDQGGGGYSAADVTQSEMKVRVEKEEEDDFQGMGLTTSMRLSSKQKVYKPIAAVVVETKQLAQTARDLRSEFSRYKLLRDFLEGDVDWSQMHPVVALCLGFRVRDGRVQQDLTVEPLGWDGLEIVPDLSDLREESGLVAKKMTLDLPEDEGATEIVIETLAGLEMFQKMKASGDLEVQRRILLGKWLYVQGFFDDQFPAITRFLPAHLANSNDDDEEEEGDE